jgi:raffinose/stachyose/melibiose transport system substrate-binding protein
MSFLVAASMVFSTIAYASAKSPVVSTKSATFTIYAQYSSDGEKTTFDYAATAMKKLYPNVKLNIDVQPQDNGVKLRTYMATGSLPDIVFLNSMDISTAVKSNSIIPLDKYVKQLNLTSQMSISAKAMLNQLNGHTYSMPYSDALFAIVYINKALFKKAGAPIPQNYDQFLTAVKKLKAANIVPMGIWLKETWPGLQLFDMISVTQDHTGNIGLDQGGTAKLSNPAQTNAAKKLIQLVNAGLVSKDAFSMTYDQAVANFEGGKAAMFICGNWLGQEVGDKLGSNAGLLLPYVFADPSKAQAVKKAGTFSGGGFPGGYAVSANCSDPDLAAEYACHFALKQIEGRIVKTGELNTVFKKIPTPEKPYNDFNKEVSKAALTIKTMTIMPWSFNSSKIETDLANEVQKLFTGQYSADQFAKNGEVLLDQDRSSK